MNKNNLEINWPNGTTTFVSKGAEWLSEAKKAGLNIPTGCLGGSCGACEIDVNGKTLRACINKIDSKDDVLLKVSFSEDPYW